MKIYHVLLCLLFSVSSLSVFGQEDINNESFKFAFVPGKGEAKVIYNGKSHAFSFLLNGKAIKQPNVNGRSDNMQFFNIDSTVFQSSFVELPQPIPSGMQLSHLTDEQERTTLEGYVNYELNYMRDDLKLTLTDVKKEWKTINSKLFLVWSFEASKPKDTPETIKTFSGQIFYSTICFNLVLDLNTPIEKKDRIEPCRALLDKISGTLTTYNNQLDLKN